MMAEETEQPVKRFSLDMHKRWELNDWRERRIGPLTPELRHSFALDFLEFNTILTFTDTREIFYYNQETGLYESAEQMIESKIQDFFERLATRHMVNEIMDTIRRYTLTKRELTNDPALIPLQNGYYDLRTRKFNAFDFKVPFFTKHPVLYDPLAICPKINGFLFDIAENDTEKTWVLQKIAAYTLYRDNPLQKAFILYGGGANGKSVFLSLLQRVLGLENCVQMSIQEITEDKFAKGRLYLKNANIFADLQSRALKDTGTFKALTGGDYQTCDRKYKDPFEFRNYAKLIFSCNQPPRFNEDSDAIYRRLIPLQFTRKFEWADQNPDLLNELSTPEELSGWLNQLLSELHELLAKKEFGIPNEHEPDKIREQYVRLADSTYYFCQSKLELSAVSFETKENIWNQYLRFCSKEKIPAMNNNRFWRGLGFYFEGHVYEQKQTIEGERTRVMRGVLLKNEEKP